MNQLQIFNSSEFGQVRTVRIEGKPYVVGNDIAKVLEYARPYEAVAAHCHGAVIHRVIDALGREQETKLIPEGDVYRLIIKAADQSVNPAIKSKAERFERWLFDEVIPTIRKTGQYGNAAYSLPVTYADALRQLAAKVEETEQLQQKVALDAPKVEAFETFIDSQGLQTIGEVAKSLGVGRNTLFSFLRQNKVIGKTNVPYHRYIERGYFTLKQTVKNGYAHGVTLVTPEGIAYLNKLLKKCFRPTDGLFLLEQ